MVVVASLNDKRNEDSSSNEDSADKSDEQDIQELAEEEIQESVEDVEEVGRGRCPRGYERSAEGRSSDTKLITC